jgi:hypothetical protein
MMNTEGLSNDFPELLSFMNGPDGPTLRRLLGYFSYESRYVHPRELKAFWESLTQSEKNYYHMLVATRFI